MGFCNSLACLLWLWSSIWVLNVELCHNLSLVPFICNCNVVSTFYVYCSFDFAEPQFGFLRGFCLHQEGFQCLRTVMECYYVQGTTHMANWPSKLESQALFMTSAASILYLWHLPWPFSSPMSQFSLRWLVELELDQFISKQSNDVFFSFLRALLDCY